MARSCIDALTDERVKRMFTADKVARGEVQKELKEHFFKTYEAEIVAEKVSYSLFSIFLIKYYVKKLRTLFYSK